MRYIRDGLDKVAVDNLQALDVIDMADLRASDSLAVKAEMIFSRFFQRGVSRRGTFSESIQHLVEEWSQANLYTELTRSMLVRVYKENERRPGSCDHVYPSATQTF